MKKNLGSVQRGRVNRPLRVVLYGPEGVGKSTFGADAPSPIFLGPEVGTDHLDVARIPAAELQTWPDVLAWLDVLHRDEHAYQALVIDTMDWIEPLIWAWVCQSEGKNDIEQFQYGKGYAKALDAWRTFLRCLDALRDHRGMWIVCLAHAKVTKLDDPRLDRAVDRWGLKLYDRDKASAADLVKEWADALLFATFDDQARARSKFDRRAAGTGRRVLCTERSPAFDAKNRHQLPAQMELSWSRFQSLVWKGLIEGPELAKALRLLREVAGEAGEAGAKALEWADTLERAGKVDRALYSKALNKLRVAADELELERADAPGAPAPEPAAHPQPAPEPAPQQAPPRAEAAPAARPPAPAREPEPASAGPVDPF